MASFREEEEEKPFCGDNRQFPAAPLADEEPTAVGAAPLADEEPTAVGAPQGAEEEEEKPSC